MPQAVLLTEETVVICSNKIDQPIADVRAMYESYHDRGLESYIVFDYYDELGQYHPWNQMTAAFFRARFRFAIGEDPKKFMHCVTI